MSNKIRSLVQKKILHGTEISELAIARNLFLKIEKTNGLFSYELPLYTNQYDIRKRANSLINEKQIDEKIFNNIFISRKRTNYDVLSINLNRDVFVKEILDSNTNGVSPPKVLDNNEKIVVEFSSPNIAKPFHVGHLRSTMIGNYIANLNTYLKNRVIKLNYLGDWGTQLGFVMLGMELSDKSEEKIKIDPIKQLYSAYVEANKLAESDSTILEKAKKIFQKLENGDPVELQRWDSFKKYTVRDLEKIYKRIGIEFDEYHWESLYNFNQIQGVIEHMEKLGLLKTDNEGRKVIPLNDNKNLPIIKSDGSTLYISRDIAAAIDRKNRYNFDNMYYVVGNSQFQHFENLITVLDMMNIDLNKKIHHVKFGQIEGMSSRKGTAILLSDILDEACTAMKEQQLQTSRTRVLGDLNDNSADILGISAVIVHDLRQRRQKDYKFNWNVALDIKGETGVRLQYTHCRLSSLAEKSDVKLPTECDPSLLQEPIVNELIFFISQFDEAVILSHQRLEPCYLTKYLFKLSHSINRTIEELWVKGEPSDVAAQRLLLYHAAKNVLNIGMKLLGISPLTKM